MVLLGKQLPAEQLRPVALAAQQLRIPVHELFNSHLVILNAFSRQNLLKFGANVGHVKLLFHLSKGIFCTVHIYRGERI